MFYPACKLCVVLCIGLASSKLTIHVDVLYLGGLSLIFLYMYHYSLVVDICIIWSSKVKKAAN